MAIQIDGNNVVDNNRKGIFQSANIGAFDNPSRPGSPTTGDIIFSTTDNQVQVWDGTAWIAATGITSITATGGDYISTSTDGNLRTHVFETSGSFVLPTPAFIETYVIAGGGAAGGLVTPVPGPFINQGHGNGGAGGLLYYQGVWESGTYSVTVGAGGVGARASGSPSSFDCPPAVFAPGTITSTGGGGGGIAANVRGPTTPGLPGGSGGGGGGHRSVPDQSAPGGTGTPGQGWAGGRGTRQPPTGNIPQSRGGGGGGVFEAGEDAEPATQGGGHKSGGGTVIHGVFPTPNFPQPNQFNPQGKRITASGYNLGAGLMSYYGSGRSIDPTSVDGNPGAVVINYNVNQVL